jgi:hypothetical protein
VILLIFTKISAISRKTSACSSGGGSAISDRRLIPGLLVRIGGRNKLATLVITFVFIKYIRSLYFLAVKYR